MKLGRILGQTPDGGEARIVAVEPEAKRVVDLARAYAITQTRRGASAKAATRLSRALFPSSMSAAIANGPALMDAATSALDAADDASSSLDDVSWLSPLDPPVIRDGLTFGQHIVNFSERVAKSLPNPNIYRIPGYFKGSTGTVYGPDQEVPYPSFSDQLDYELEIGYVVGAPAHDVEPADVFQHVFGITIFNDWSARDAQGGEMAIGMGPQHSKDFAYSIGPWITTIDEIPSIEGLSGTATVNGEVWSTTKAEQFVWAPDELVAYASQHDLLQPGDIIGSGTMGFGSALELGKTLSPGDAVELWLEGVGTLRNTLSATKVESAWWPTARPYPFETQEADK